MSRQNNREATESSRNQRNRTNHGERSAEDIIKRIELQLNINQSENMNVRGTRTARRTTRVRTTYSNDNTASHSTRECNPTWDARRGEQRHPSWGPGQPSRPSQRRTANYRSRQWRNERNGPSYNSRTGRGQREIVRHAHSAQNQEQRRQPRRY
jgi:hypothetical protein